MSQFFGRLANFLVTFSFSVDLWIRLIKFEDIHTPVLQLIECFRYFLPWLPSHSIPSPISFFLLISCTYFDGCQHCSGIYLGVYIVLIHQEIRRYSDSSSILVLLYIGNNSRSFSFAHSISIQFSFSLSHPCFTFLLPSSSPFGDSLSCGTTYNYSYLFLWNLTAYDLPLLDKDNSPRCTRILLIFSSGTKTEEVIFDRLA